MPTLEQALEQLRQFKRTCKLVVSRTSTPAAGEDYFVRKVGSPDGKSTNGIEITDLRVRFMVERSLKAKHNKCDVEIFNLVRESRSAMELKPLAVELYAGHVDVNQLVLTGDVLFAMSKLESANWVTMLQVGDGARALANSRVSLPYSKTTTVKQVLRDICQTMGQKLPSNIENLSELDQQFGNGGVIHGSSRVALERVLERYGIEASIQNGKLQMLRVGDTRADVHAVNEHNGMIGSPEFGQPRGNGKPPTMSVKMLLRPEIVPGSTIDLKSEHKSGRFKVAKVKHEGDTHDPSWFTELEIRPLGQ